MKKYAFIALLAIVVTAVSFFVFADNEGVELPVVMYHSTLKDGARIGDYVASPDTFESDVKYLKQNGYETVTVNDLVSYVYDNKPLPDKPVMITFDDGFYNNYFYAEPILKKYGMRAVLSVVGKYVDDSVGLKPNPAYSYVTWDDIKNIQESGVFEIQNHTYNLHSFTQSNKGSKIAKGESREDYEKRFCSDAVKMQRLLLDSGVISYCYTYPYGSYCKESEEYIKKLGFRASLSCNEGINKITSDPECLYLLKRYNRTGKSGTVEFFNKVFD